MIHDGMTKASLSVIANGISKLTKGTEVTVNTILGGSTYSKEVSQIVEKLTKTQNLDFEEIKNSILQQSNPHFLLQRFIDPAEIANLATYLSSPFVNCYKCSNFESRCWSSKNDIDLYVHFLEENVLRRCSRICKQCDA